MTIDRDDNLMSSPEKLKAYLLRRVDSVQQTMSTNYLNLLDNLQNGRINRNKFVKQTVGLWKQHAVQLDEIHGIKNDYLLGKGVRELARNEEIAFNNEKLAEFKQVRSGIGATYVAVFAYHKDLGLAGIHLDTTDPRVIETWLNKNIGNIDLIRMLGDTGFDRHPQLLDSEGVLTKVRRAINRTAHQIAFLTGNPGKPILPWDTEIWLTGLGSYKPNIIRTVSESIDKIIAPYVEWTDDMRREIRTIDPDSRLNPITQTVHMRPYLKMLDKRGKSIYLPYPIEEKGLGTFQQIVYQDKTLSYQE